MKHTLALILALTVTPALAINTKPETPQKEAPKEKPAPERRSAPEPKSEPRAETRSSREPERENECPHDQTDKWHACLAPTVSLRPKARPVTNQAIPAGELK